MNSSLVALTVDGFFDKMAQNPPPGGGSAAALAGLMGVSLLEMASRQQIAGPDLAAVQAELAGLHQSLSGLIDRDAAVLAAVLPLLSQADLTDNVAAGQLADAVEQAIAVPLSIARSCVRGLELARILLNGVAGHVAGDLLIGALACQHAVTGALLMAAVNIPLLPDAAVQAGFRTQLRLIDSAAKALIDELQSAVYAREPYRFMK
ncbi:cyclodeaminase/cyclohydrolase family protein|uniref:Formimidoyltetrahydrofolate cyclodeaminase n=1 Tax=Dendrosporobacter quercicolus TaxID=146817 RepID=A0A1G9TMX5_9FIRM|nr:cyclodeaminase/cyclohydrolase family protein [Dendrosporobacter quercicolus]NSL48910.1 cyclodeaminase/cyclohydrolase family protein [Dendrosporobacter quercicolus DSM 1736]SDM49040.1 Formimidoyltetrahydrofolate cyclodeaminase [Dendrosporobacter quercicolus]